MKCGANIVEVPPAAKSWTISTVSSIPLQKLAESNLIDPGQIKLTLVETPEDS